jgi:hypothetical protein
MRDRTGNLPPLYGIFPDYSAPIVRNQPEGRELKMARWGMPSPVFALQGKISDPGNKFLAKLASDHGKPDGLFVITPKMGHSFVERLPVEKFHGVGPATTASFVTISAPPESHVRPSGFDGRRPDTKRQSSHRAPRPLASSASRSRRVSFPVARAVVSAAPIGSAKTRRT